jgi:hypothetical protein
VLPAVGRASRLARHRACDRPGRRRRQSFRWACNDWVHDGCIRLGSSDSSSRFGWHAFESFRLVLAVADSIARSQPNQSNIINQIHKVTFPSPRRISKRSCGDCHYEGEHAADHGAHRNINLLATSAYTEEDIMPKPKNEVECVQK